MTDQNLKMPKESAVDYMIRIVKDWVGNGTYKSGDKLPSESELCRLTNISRGSIREAMKILSALGVVDIRQGSGTYITEQYTEPLVEPLLLNLRKSAWSVNDLMDFREMIEKSVVELIIRNAGDDELAELERINERLKETIESENDRQKELDIDIEFHKMMAKCTKNVLCEILYDFVLDFIFYDMKRLYEENNAMGYVSYLLHQRMVDAMSRRDAAMAKETIVEAMKNHIKAGSALDAFGGLNSIDA